MRIAIYARVSTDNKGQDPENQLRQLREWCANAGHELVAEYIDKESGRKGTNERKQFALLFEDAYKRKFDTVLFWALDRLTREGMIPTVNYLQRLAGYGVGFHSYTEPHLATDDEMVRSITLAVLATLAKQEAKRISERTKAGLARARAQGKRLGRPGISDKLKAKIATRIARGETPYRVAKDLGIDRHTAAKYGALPFREAGQAAAAQVI
jgi:DNA invertase Pin-like site-specific DNA recombinase